MPQVGLLCSRIRVEEKLLIREMEKRGADFEIVDDRKLVLEIEQNGGEYDVILERCINHSRALYALRIFSDWGVPTVNTYEVANICGNKLLTTSALVRAGIPTPRTRVAFTPDSALWREANPATEAPAAGGIPADAALKITGKVTAEIGWAEDQVRAMETIQAESTNKAGETKTYTGVPLNALLELAGPQGDATTLSFVADDGFASDVDLAEAQACVDCIVSFRNQGGFSMVMPGFSSKAQVKGVIEIQVK